MTNPNLFPPDPNDPSGDTFTIWHVVMEHATVTFLDYDMLKDFLGERSVESLRKITVVCTSTVTADEYNRMTEWNVGSHTS